MSQRFESGSLNQNMSMESSLAGMNDFRPELHVAQQSLRDDFRPESHVAQQSRRDKLRVQQNPVPVHHIQDFSNHLVQLPRDLGLNHDLIQVRNVRNCNSLSDPTMFSSEMHNFSTNNTHVLLAHKDAIMQQESCDDQPGMPEVRENSSFGNFNASAKASDPRNPCHWKDLESQRSYDWIVNYANGSGSNACNQYPSFVGGILSGTVKENNISASTHQCLKPGYNGYQVVRSPLSNPSGEISSQDSQKKQVDMGFNSSLFYQNPLQDVVTSSTIGSQELDMASLVRQNIRESGHGSWVDGGNELVLLPTYADQINVSRLNNPGAWMHRPVEGCHQGNAGLGFTASKSEGNIGNLDRDSTAQGLSLSLSSHHPELYAAQCGETFGSKDLQCRTGIFSGSQDPKSINPSRFCLNSKLSIDNKGYENSIQGIAGSSMYAHRSTGPLGPFTGYATILKSSKFLRPAQQLLDEFCSVTDAKVVKTHEMPEKCSGDTTILHDAMNSENEIGGREGGYGIGSCQSYGPEFQRKKAKLLYMQEEVCRRYKQYHQQMQIVVSSFESVAGLSAATPYISLALKSISRHFKCMKNAISDQLQHVSKALGEKMSSPTTGASSKDHTATQRLRFIDSGLGKHKYAGDSHTFLEPQQHVWRPHRGLPERSVAILRAWLFEHFLHPYPTDTDKHLLATQTGLSRNQVSNWFINARVRVWKPMVEEVHMLETKGSAAMVLDSRKNDGETSSNSGSGPSGEQASNKTTTNAMSDRQSECPAVTHMANSNDEWRGCQIQGHMDGGLIGFMPYHQSGLEIGGLGAVSLTLGLRHSAENAQQQLQQQKSRD